MALACRLGQEGIVMTEQRGHPRAHVLRRAKIVFRRGYSAMDCVVLDLSPAGARLKVDQWLALPDRFELRIENGPGRLVGAYLQEENPQAGDVANVNALDD